MIRYSGRWKTLPEFFLKNFTTRFFLTLLLREVTLFLCGSEK